MSDLRDLYQEVILDHNKKPRNFGKLESPDRQASGHNPLCGDQCSVYLKMEGEQIADIRFEGQGCAISKASASMMTSALKGKSLTEAKEIFSTFHEMVASETELEEEEMEALGKLAVFSGIREYPTRVKCASLPWHTLRAALETEPEPISTE